MADQRETEVDHELLEQRKAEQAGLTKEQITNRKRKPVPIAKGAAQDREQREHAESFQPREIVQEVDLTLTPAGKFTDAMASDIWKAVVDAAWEEPNTRSLIEEQFATAERFGFHKGSRNKKRQTIEQVVAEIYGFKTKERAMDAIHELATQLQFAVRKQPGHEKRKASSG